MITPEQIAEVLADSLHEEPDPDYGHSYHQDNGGLEVEITGSVVHLGDSFYGIPFDVDKLRANFAKLGIML